MSPHTIPILLALAFTAVWAFIAGLMLRERLRDVRRARVVQQSVETLGGALAGPHAKRRRRAQASA